MLKGLQASPPRGMFQSDMSTDHSSQLYLLVGKGPTPALTLAISLSCFHSLPSFPFSCISSKQNHKHYAVASVHDSLSLMLHLDLHYLQFTSDMGLVHKHRACYVVWTTMRKRRTQTATGPLSWKWFYSFTVISLNNDAKMTRLPLAN